MKLLAERMANLGSENAFRVGDDIRRAEQTGVNVIRFNLGEPDFNSPPFINKVAIEEISKGNSHYCNPAGLDSFRVAIARHLTRTREVPVDPEQIVVTTGAKPRLAML